MKVFHSKGFILTSDSPEEAPESISESEPLNELDRGILSQIRDLALSMSAPGKTDMEKHQLKDEIERLKKAKNEFDSKQKGQISTLTLERKKMADIYSNLYNKYSPFLPPSPQYHQRNIFQAFSTEEIKKDFSILKKYYDILKENIADFSEIIRDYEAQGLPVKLYFNEDLGKYLSLRQKYFGFIGHLLNYSNDFAYSHSASEELKKFNQSLESFRDDLIQDYKGQQEELLASFLGFVNNFIRNSKSEEEELTLDAVETKFMENIMKKEAKYFYLFQNSDSSGGYWELDKEAGFIKKLPSSKKEISSSKGEPEMIKKALKDGGVWKYSIGDKITIDSEFGFISAEVSQLLPESNYIVKNDKDLKNGIQVTESDIFDPSVSL